MSELNIFYRPSEAEPYRTLCFEGLSVNIGVNPKDLECNMARTVGRNLRLWIVISTFVILENILEGGLIDLKIEFGNDIYYWNKLKVKDIVRTWKPKDVRYYYSIEPSTEFEGSFENFGRN
ncbi:MAG: hypothetical protein ABIK73_07070 [candidate division WOR-3 bacterium]